MTENNTTDNAKQAVFQKVECGKPILLNDSESVWILQSGKADIFVVKVEDGREVGRRKHFFRAEPGQALFGVNFDKHGVGLLLCCFLGSRLLKLKKSELMRLPNKMETIFIIESWVACVSSGIRDALPPKIFKRLNDTSELLLQNNDSVLTKDDIFWVKQLEGESCFMGNKEIVIDSNSGFVPITPSSWLNSLGNGKLLSLRTTSYMKQDPSLSGLEEFHKLMLKRLLLRKEREQEEISSRFGARVGHDRLHVENAFSQLSSVLESKKSGMFFEGLEFEPLLEACKLVGNELDIEIKAPSGLNNDVKFKDPVISIARSSKIKARKVGLKKDWWKTDNGPLLSYLKHNGAPVALIPVSATKYMLNNPAERGKTVVDENVTRNIEDFGFTFYRSFPTHAVTALKLMRFGLKGCVKDIIMLAVMGMAGGLLGMAIPLATGLLFDSIIPQAERGQILQIGFALIVSALAAAVFQLTRSVAMLRIEGKMDASLQSAVWNRLLSLPAPFFRKFTSGDLANRAMGINNIREVLSGNTLTTVLSCVFSIFNFGLLFYYDHILALFVTGIVLFSLLFATVMGYIQVRQQRELMDLEGRIAGLVFQFINGISKFRVSGSENRAFAVWAKVFSRKKKVAYNARITSNIVNVFNSVYRIVTIIIVFAVIVYFRKESMSTGTFLAFSAAYGQFQMSVLQLSSVVISSINIVPIYERLKPILLAEPEIDETKIDPGELSGELEVNNVSFRYKEDGPLILEDVSVQVKPGEFVALVGPSGGGKSTLFRILLGFEVPEIGEIYYDKQDLSAIDLQAVRRQIGVVLQSAQLLGGTIFSNIVGSSRLTIDDAWEAARMCGFDEDIKQMPMGMQTLISEGKSSLSGGQAQRLIIARAIATRPRILYFDEATSALDNKTQSIVSESLENLKVTRVVIAHRLSTVIKADKIIVIDKGRVVQAGPYDELVKQPGTFAELAKRQIV